MPAYDKAKIQRYLRKADRASGKKRRYVRGKAYGDLARYLFSCVPGITITHSNEMDSFATEEIDVACYNEQHPQGLRSLPPNFLVE
jgi:hypothetical protein